MNILKIMILVILGAALAGVVFALPSPAPTQGGKQALSAHTAPNNENDLRFEGEQRFRTNCGRCHVAPHKFPPRMMATILRHMRVRATLTDTDMRIILRYMTQ